MRFTADVSKLRDALTLAASAVKDRTPNPALAYVHCVADGGGLHLTGGNGERFVTVPCEAVVEVPGRCMFHSRAAATLREYDGEVGVELGAGGLKLTFHNGPQELPLADPREYPVPDDPPADPTLTLPAEALKAALARTAFAASKDEGKYAMRGVLWDGNSLVATDGKRLALAEVGVKSPAPALLPPDSMGFVSRLCESGDVRVSLLENAAYFVTDAGTVYTQLVAGRFPPFRDVIPKSATTVVTLDAGGFLADVRRAALATDDESKRVEFDFRGGKVVMQARSATAGSAAVTHAAMDQQGPDVVIAFDPAYLTGAREALSGSVALSMNGPEKSAVFRREGGLYLVVPLV